MKKIIGLLFGTLVIASCATNQKSEVREPQQVGTGGVGTLSVKKDPDFILLKKDIKIPAKSISTDSYTKAVYRNFSFKDGKFTEVKDTYLTQKSERDEKMKKPECVFTIAYYENGDLDIFKQAVKFPEVLFKSGKIKILGNSANHGYEYPSRKLIKEIRTSLLGSEKETYMDLGLHHGYSAASNSMINIKYVNCYYRPLNYIDSRESNVLLDGLDPEYFEAVYNNQQ